MYALFITTFNSPCPVIVQFSVSCPPVDYQREISGSESVVIMCSLTHILLFLSLCLWPCSKVIVLFHFLRIAWETNSSRHEEVFTNRYSELASKCRFLLLNIYITSLQACAGLTWVRCRLLQAAALTVDMNWHSLSYKTPPANFFPSCLFSHVMFMLYRTYIPGLLAGLVYSG